MDSQERLEEYNETPNQSFTVLLQGERQYYNEIPPQPKVTSTTKRTNFSVEEDILLVKAWINTSIDPIHGNDQKSTKFWDRILEKYNENKKETTVERTAHSLSNRWCSIQKFTNKFCGYLAQVESRNQSGHSEQDKINEAKAMYREFNNNIIFQFEHCWNLLKTLPKWKTMVQLKLKGRSAGTCHSSPHDVIHLGEGNDCGDAVVDLERPLGKKASKERERKRKSIDCGEKEIVMEVLNGLTEVKKRSYEERKKEINTAKEEIIQIEKQKLEIQLRKEAREYKKEKFEKVKLEIELRKEAREQKREEREIMMMDTSHLSQMQLEYIQSLQMEIIEKRRSK